jgi:hypothetical protein
VATRSQIDRGRRPKQVDVARLAGISPDITTPIYSAFQRGIQDVAVADFDDIPAAQHATPPLTTVAQHPELLGCRAAEMPYELVIRVSA